MIVRLDEVMGAEMALRDRDGVPWGDMLPLSAVLLLLVPAVLTLAQGRLLSMVWIPPWSVMQSGAAAMVLGYGIWGLAAGLAVGAFLRYRGANTGQTGFSSLFQPLSFFTLAVWFTLVLGLGPEPPGSAWGALLAGLGVGMLLGGLVCTWCFTMARRDVSRSALDGMWLACFGLLALSLFWSGTGTGGSGALELSGEASGYFAHVSQRFYLMLRMMLPGIPLGLTLVLAFSAPRVRAGVSMAVLLLLAGQAVFFTGAGWVVGLDLLLVLPGLALGMWLGQRVPGLTPAAGLVEPGRQSGTKVPDQANVLRQAARMPVSPNTSEVQADIPPDAGRRDVQEPAPPLLHAKSWAWRLLGGGILILAGWLVTDFPRWPLVLGAGLALYGVLLWRYPAAWLVTVPTALPLMDLAPWSGRLFLDEFDLLLMTTLGVLLLRGRWRRARPWSGGAVVLFLLAGVFYAYGALVGVWPLPPLDANALASYWSPYNGLRVAKGALWGGILFLMFRHTFAGPGVRMKLFALGMSLGLLGVGLAGAWEHALFSGSEAGKTYRIFATFSSMHTGGGHIEAYLVGALPFLWLLAERRRDALVAAPLMVLTAYVMLYTVARGGVLALGVVLVILVVASLRTGLVQGMRRQGLVVLLLLALGGVTAAGVGVGYFQQRFAQTGEDIQTRLDHWGRAVALMDDTWRARLLGMGLGSFPRVYQERGPLEGQPASFGFAREAGNAYFRLGTGETLYYAQRVAFEPGQTYRLELDLRSRQGPARLDTPICEKQLLNSRQCLWFGFNVPGDGGWHRFTRTVSHDVLGSGPWWRHPPVELFLHHPDQAGVLDVDNLRLLDAAGQDLLCNGDFAAGGDCWFFKTHSHLPWHIKNVWVHAFFEQGGVGLALLTGLTGLALVRLARAGWQGHRPAWAWLAALSGMLTVGLFDSLLDTPRLAVLLVLGLLVGGGWTWSRREGEASARQLQSARRGGHAALG